uniref:Uncharacterized protein n=1 Tax=Meloidogyne enterolobii TaxID=390850 RepID=A0A6V7WU19_MELEN|nr:unnamed protein product [Meloidogyne enterolobii]
MEFHAHPIFYMYFCGNVGLLKLSCFLSILLPKNVNKPDFIECLSNRFTHEHANNNLSCYSCQSHDLKINEKYECSGNNYNKIRKTFVSIKINTI